MTYSTDIKQPWKDTITKICGVIGIIAGIGMVIRDDMLDFPYGLIGSSFTIAFAFGIYILIGMFLGWIVDKIRKVN